MRGKRGSDRKRFWKKGQQRPKERKVKIWEGNEEVSGILCGECDNPCHYFRRSGPLERFFLFCLNKFLIRNS